MFFMFQLTPFAEPAFLHGPGLAASKRPTGPDSPRHAAGGTSRVELTQVASAAPASHWAGCHHRRVSDSDRQRLGEYEAAALVAGSSAAVLVVELTSLRLLAPFLGLTLETSTIVIGTALAAIAVGSWSGGRLADRIPPLRAIGPLLAVSGVAVALTPFAVRAAGALPAAWALVLILVSSLSIIVPGSLLAAVTPMVTKLRLTSLAETGTVVGRLSGIGTVGAIAGTVITGFVLISRVPVSGILVGLGVLLVLAAAVVEWRTRGPRAAALPAALVLVGGLAAAVAPGGCDAETTYHCAVVVADPERPSGRTLELDGLRHSYVDLADPRHLEFPYIRAIVAAIDTEFPGDRPLRAYHLGGGGLTVPRYLAETRPGTTSVVSEIDPGVVARRRGPAGIPTGRAGPGAGRGRSPRPAPAARRQPGSGRRRRVRRSQRAVAPDHPGGDRRRRPGADSGRGLRAEPARLRPAGLRPRRGGHVAGAVRHVAVAAESGTLDDPRNEGGNLVVVASDRADRRGRAPRATAGRRCPAGGRRRTPIWPPGPATPRS